MAARRNAGTQTAGVNILYNVYGVMRVFSEQIQQSNLGNVLLILNSLGIDDRVHLPLDPPPAETLIMASEHFSALGALSIKEN